MSCTGVGVHSGVVATLTLHPAPAHTGVVFRRVDLLNGDAGDQTADIARVSLPARYDLVTDTRLGTSLCNEHGVAIATVEHLMAAIVGCGLDNAIVDVDGPEMPIMDGSSTEFVRLIEAAGVRELSAARKSIRVLKPVSVEIGDASAAITPDNSFSIDATIMFEDPAIGRQSKQFHWTDGAFKAQLADARTFGFLSDVETLKSMGLARGGSLDNTVVIDDGRILNEAGLRYDDEFVRHKMLDMIGDLALAGAPLIGRISAYKPGHGVNNALLRRLFSDAANWSVETIVDESGDREKSRVAVAV